MNETLILSLYNEIVWPTLESTTMMVQLTSFTSPPSCLYIKFVLRTWIVMLVRQKRKACGKGQN